MGPERPLRKDKCVCAPASWAPRPPGKRATQRLTAWWRGQGRPCQGAGDAAGPCRPGTAFPVCTGLGRMREERGDREGGDSGQDTGPGGTALCPSLSWPSQGFQLFWTSIELQICQNISTKYLFLLSSSLRISKEKEKGISQTHCPFGTVWRL